MNHYYLAWKFKGSIIWKPFEDCHHYFFFDVRILNSTYIVQNLQCHRIHIIREKLKRLNWCIQGEALGTQNHTTPLLGATSSIFKQLSCKIMVWPKTQDLVPPSAKSYILYWTFSRIEVKTNTTVIKYQVKNKFHHEQMKLFCLLTERRSSTSAGFVDVTSLSRTTCWSTRERTQTSVPTRATSVGKRSDARTISGTTGKQTTALEVFHNYSKLAMLEGIRVEHRSSRVQSPLEVAELILFLSV